MIDTTSRDKQLKAQLTMNSATNGNASEKTYLLAHQNLCITSIDFAQQNLAGFTELHFVPLKLNKVSKICLNAKQCHIVKLLAKGSSEYRNCTFTFNDPLQEVVPLETRPDGEPVVPEKNIKKYSARHQEAVSTTELDVGGGEIVVTLPEEVQKEVSDGSTFKIFVEYLIEKPTGGLQFVLPKNENQNSPTIDLTNLMPNKDNATAASNDNPSDPSDLQLDQTQDDKQAPAQGSPRIESGTNGLSPQNSDQSSESEDEEPTSRKASKKDESNKSVPVKKEASYAHLFTYKNHNSSRLWFPCLDSYEHLCSWQLEFTVQSHLTVISCGELIGTSMTPDKRFKTFRYELNVPTSSTNIGFVAGQFESVANAASLVTNCPMRNYYLSRLEKLIEPSCGFLTDCAEFYEDFLTFKYPYTNYKQVFVDQAYDDYQSYATMSICDTSLLHSKRIINQTFLTRAILSEALAVQYFGCFISMSSWAAAWVTRGISTFVAGQYRRKIFGNNEYRYNVRERMAQVIEYEQKYGGIVLDETMGLINRSKNSFHFSTQCPHTISPFFDEAHKNKSFLVIRMLEDRIGRTLLLQVFNKILSLASNTSLQPASMNVWSNMLLSTQNFDRAVFTVTGKDKEIASFLEQWVYQGGHAKFNGSFAFDRKRNVVELNIRQPDTSSTGIRPYFGSITVTVQELDGTFPQKLNIEENKTTPFVITCHSKSRRNKKKKIPLCTGEEVDMDLSMMDNNDSPVLWIRIDPDMQVLRQIVFEQPDYNWQYQLKYERDVTAQLDSLTELMNYQTIQTRKTLLSTIEDERCFYRVRVRAALNLTKIANDMAFTHITGGWQAPQNMINIYKNLFGSPSCPNIVRMNNFSATNLQSYFLQMTIPEALAALRLPPHRICPPEVLKFLLDLFKYNDNSKNAFSDNYYRAALIRALAETVTPVVVPIFTSNMQLCTIEQIPSETKLVLDEIVRYLNMDKLLPCYKQTITVACLEAIQSLQRMGHLPSNPYIFRCYAAEDLFYDVRCAAVKQIVGIIKAEQSYSELDFLLDLVENDRVPRFKFFILSQLHRNPPVSISSYPNCGQIKERLWTMMNTTFAHDSKLRCVAADVYHKFFGKSDKFSLSSGFPGDPNHKSKKKKKKKDKDKDREKKKSKKIKLHQQLSEVK